uniref:Uncharacterized protein n=1 Tax=Glossina austeni TaxID=7395 RepID=A0A1A9V4G8_GLOAU
MKKLKFQSPKTLQQHQQTVKYGSKIRSRKIEKCLTQLQQALRSDGPIYKTGSEFVIFGTRKGFDSFVSQQPSIKSDGQLNRTTGFIGPYAATRDSRRRKAQFSKEALVTTSFVSFGVV